MVDGGGAQLVATVDEIDLVAYAGQVDGVRRRRVAAADNDHVASAEEIAVAGGAIRHAAPLQLILPRKAELSRTRTRRHDDRTSLIGSECGRDLFRGRREIDGDDLLAHRLRPKGRCLLVHHHGKLEPALRLRETRVVLEMLRLSKLPAEGQAFEHRAIQSRARSVERRGHAGRPRPDNRQIQNAACPRVANIRHLHSSPRARNPLLPLRRAKATPPTSLMRLSSHNMKMPPGSTPGGMGKLQLRDKRCATAFKRAKRADSASAGRRRSASSPCRLRRR